MNDTIIQIVPRRGIAPEGVGDYARIIAERLLSDHGLRTIFVSGSPLPSDQRMHDTWETHELPIRGAKVLFEILSRIGGGTVPPVLMHHSGYGYHDKGVPIWIARALGRWRRGNPTTPLVTIFHEIYATGPVTGSAFWLSPLQKYIARHILAQSTAALATTEPYTARLRSWSQGTRPVINLPVFSTVGETMGGTAASRRAPDMVVFGRSGIYDAIYVAGRAEIEAFVEQQGIRRIIDIGARVTPPPAMIGIADVETRGELPAAELRERLAEARFGLLHYNADRLAKSTIFAAYCAQGSIPVCLSDSPGYTDGVTPGRDYIKLSDETPNAAINSSKLDALQAAAVRWYRPHSLTATIDTVYGLLHSRQSAEG